MIACCCMQVKQRGGSFSRSTKNNVLIKNFFDFLSFSLSVSTLSRSRYIPIHINPDFSTFHRFCRCLDVPFLDGTFSIDIDLSLLRLWQRNFRRCFLSSPFLFLLSAINSQQQSNLSFQFDVPLVGFKKSKNEALCRHPLHYRSFSS